MFLPLSATTPSTPPLLQVDSDGNGEVDSQVNPTVTLTGDSASDQTPPKTLVNLGGIRGDNGWFKDSVTVELIGQDEASGSGVVKTEFNLANTSKVHTYTKPFTISREGISKLKVKSTDSAGNEELPQEIEIKIDKTAPELKITPDFRNRQLKVTGKDNLSTTQTQATASGEATITDQAGHSLKLAVKEKQKPRQDKISIESLSYDNQPTINLEENKLKVEFSRDKKDNILRELKQQITLKGEIKMVAHYDEKKNQTRISIKEKGVEKQKIDKTGLILLKLITNNGKLEANY